MGQKTLEEKREYQREWRKKNRDRLRDYNREHQRARRKKLGHKTRAEQKAERIQRENAIYKRAQIAIDTAIYGLQRVHMKNYGKIDMEQIMDNIKPIDKTMRSILAYDKLKGISQ